jgi:hypothetical protein
MDEEQKLKEPSAVYAVTPTLDLSHLTVIQQDGQPVGVFIPYAEYQRLMEERRRAREEWSQEFGQLLEEIHSRMPDLPPDEVEADITAAFEEMKAELYSARRA